MPDKIIEEINNLITLTMNDKINWILMQPNNFNAIKWDRAIDDKTYSTTIQKQPRPNAAIRPGIVTQSTNNFYFFSIIKNTPAPPDVFLQLNTQVEPQYKEILERLFTAALDSAKKSASEILNNLIKGL